MLDPEAPPEVDVDRLILIVVGAHLRAEMSDRPLAYRLRERVLRWLDQRVKDPDDEIEPLDPIVCADLWYLNNEDLLQRPTIAIGAPGVNAATAYFANRLPVAFVMEDTLQVQLDVEFASHWGCLWGVNASATASAADLFAERYLDSFLRSVHGLPPGSS